MGCCIELHANQSLHDGNKHIVGTRFYSYALQNIVGIGLLAVFQADNCIDQQQIIHISTLCVSCSKSCSAALLSAAFQSRLSSDDVPLPEIHNTSVPPRPQRSSPA